MDLPAQANYVSVCGARIKEVKAIEKELANCIHGQRAYQKLPRNMQRRALSNNPQRLPVHLRERHKQEVGNIIKANKKPSRKYRRRPSRLLSEYNRRQRKYVWLESHIWHAKRFHMARKWGYSLPVAPTNKSYRPCLRAANETCLLQDVSYECTLEIEGPYEEIVGSLKHMISEEDWSNFSSSDFQLGLTWFSVVLYEPKSYPYQALGEVQILASNDTDSGDPQKIWIWVHPSIYEDVVNSLVKIYDLKLHCKNTNKKIEKGLTKDITKNKESKDVKVKKKVLKGFKVKNKGSKGLTAKKKGLKDVKVKNKSLKAEKKIKNDCTESSNTTDMLTDSTDFKLSIEIIKYTSPSINLSILKDTLVKFRLTGPRSYFIIQDVIKPLFVKEEQETENSNETNTPWWVDFYSDNSNYKTLENQLNLWSSFNGKPQKSRKVCSFIARDPRIVLPTKKKSILDAQDLSQSTNENVEVKKLRTHPIFLEAIRKSVTLNLESTGDINERRSRLLVPGSSLPVGKTESRIPVLLMQRPGSHVNNELGHGWDIVMPAGCGASAIVSFAMNGATVGGQDQELALQTEFLIHPTPQSIPDTKVGRNLMLQGNERKEEYFKRPPNCRLNYIKLCVRFPFAIDWLELIQSWEPSATDFYVIRKRNVLESLSKIACPKLNKQRSSISQSRMIMDESDLTSNENEDAPQNSISSIPFNPKCDLNIQLNLNDFKNALLYIRLVLIGKGNLEPLSMIALPTEDDVKSFYTTESHEITEIVHKDENAKMREHLRSEHQRTLKILRRKRKRARQKAILEKEHANEKQNIGESVQSAVENVCNENEELIKEINSYSSKINELWLQDKTTIPLQSCNRKIIGYLTQGGFCLNVGRPAGLGYVACQPFVSYLNQIGLTREEVFQNPTESHKTRPSRQVFILVRTPSTYVYRWARVIVLNNWQK